MSKTSNPVLKEGLGIVARLVVIAMLLGVLSTVLQGCSAKEEVAYAKDSDPLSSFTLSAEDPAENDVLVLL